MTARKPTARPAHTPKAAARRAPAASKASPSRPAAKPKPKAIPTADIQAAWTPGVPTRDAWTPRPWVSVAERVAAGRAARQNAPRSAHGAVELPADRDPIAILAAQELDRLQDLVPLRHQRMAENAFAYYRGTPAVMAADLATTPRSGIIVQASGDAHISNFGLFASPERTLVFDSNDFDETLPGPWEWDVKRLAVSVQIAARANGFDAAECRSAVLAAVKRYRDSMTMFAGMSLLDIWYDQTTSEQIAFEVMSEAARIRGFDPKVARKALDSLFQKARGKDQLKAVGSLTREIDGEWRIVPDPPVVQHVDIVGGAETLSRIFSEYRSTLAENRRELVERYRFIDVALKVVGVGSVGTRCFILLLEGRDRGDPLILQVKEATASVLEPYLGKDRHSNSGERVVVGQRLMQATPDIFLGWTRGPEGRDFYFRQLWDMKGSVETAALRLPGLSYYGGLCARTLARAHARSGDAVAIAAYLGTGDTFDGAIADFSETYADINERDHQAYLAAIDDGRVSVPAPAKPA